MESVRNKGSFGEVFITALKLGLTSFGGPTAHVGYFREEYVNRKQWLSERKFAEYMALAQFLPGPASSQLGMAIGIERAGVKGSVAAWLGFTLPSAFIMLLFALAAGSADLSQTGWLQGLKLAAVAVVGLAVWSMGKTLAEGPVRTAMAIGSALAALLIPGAGGQLIPLVICAVLGLLWLKPTLPNTEPSYPHSAADHPITKPVISYPMAWTALALFAVLLAALPIASRFFSSPLLALVDSAYRAGSLVFGGGHVILPMLEHEVVGSGAGKLSAETFTAGYGAVQAVPGPLFTFAAYIGGAMAGGFKGILYGTAALISIFLPSFLLLVGALPFWHSLRGSVLAQAALMGVNAAVVGILLAALYNPIWHDAVRSPRHFAIVLLVFLLLHVWKRQPWQAVLFSALAGWLLL